MAIYHFTAQVISRNKGRSSVAAAAYRAGEKLYNQYDGVTSDYTRKSGVVHTEITLPEFAPKEFMDRQTLWNAVEKIEKSKNAQTAREIEIAIPKEFSREDQLSLLRAYIQKNFVDRGMCADFALHDKGDGNPHAHIMLTMRPIRDDGSWGEKQKKIYELDNEGKKIYNPNKKTYKCHTEKTTDWDRPETLVEWREQWAAICNSEFERLEIDERIDHRSYEERCIHKIPTKHLGPFASKLEKQNILTEIGVINQNIQQKNAQFADIEKQIKDTNERIVVLETYRQRLTKLQSAIDKAIDVSSTYEDFLQQLQTDGYEIKRGKHIAFRSPGEERFIRSKTLGIQYTEESIIRRIAQKDTNISHPQTGDNKIDNRKNVNLLIDIENHMKCLQSPGYAQWAKINNLKQSASTLSFLTDNNIQDYNQLQSATTKIKSNHQQLTNKLKSLEKILTEMNGMIKNITTYQQTKLVYEQYQKAVFKEKFYKQHSSEIILYRAAKKALDSAQSEGKLLDLKILTREYAEKLKEKEELYQEYESSKKEAKQYDIINANVKKILALESENESNDMKKHEDISRTL